MSYRNDLEKAKHIAKWVAIVSAIFMMIITVVVPLIGRINRDERIASTIKGLSGCVFRYNLNLDSYKVTYSLEFSDKEQGKGIINITGEHNETGTFEYEVSTNFFGIETLRLHIKYSDGDETSWNMLVGKNAKGQVWELDHIDSDHNYFRNRSIAGSGKAGYENTYLRYIYLACWGLVCVLNVVCLCNIVIKDNAFTNYTRRQAQADNDKLVEDKRQYLHNEWQVQMRKLNFNKSDAVTIALNNWFWIANDKVYEAENMNNYIHRHINKDLKVYHNLYKEIAINDIQYFAKEGDIQYTTKITGGGGGGSSLTGAIIGGLLAGEAGAIIGSRQKVQEIHSECVAHDLRQTIIRYYKGKELCVVSYEGDEVYNYLLRKIPEKDLLSIQLTQTIKPTTDSGNATNNVEDKLLKLKKLYEDGLISLEDYEGKKKEVLSNF